MYTKNELTIIKSSINAQRAYLRELMNQEESLDYMAWFTHNFKILDKLIEKTDQLINEASLK